MVHMRNGYVWSCLFVFSVEKVYKWGHFQPEICPHEEGSKQLHTSHLLDHHRSLHFIGHGFDTLNHLSFFFQV